MTRNTIRVGSIINIPHHIKIKSKYPYPDDGTLDIDLDQIQIYKIEGEEVTYDFPDNKRNNWRTTFDELERVGVLEKDVFEEGDEVECISLEASGEDPYWCFTDENIKIGDKVIIKEFHKSIPLDSWGNSVRVKNNGYIYPAKNFKKVKKESMKVGDIFTMKTYTGPCAVVGNARNWDEGTISAGTYQIKKLTATQVYFEGENYNDTDFWILKKPVFESIAVFENKAKTKTITGYKLLKDTPDAKAGTLISANGDYTGTKGHIMSYSKDYLTNIIWFEPVYAAIYKQGDLVTDDNCKNVYVYSHQTGTRHYSTQDPISFGCNLRHLTPAEIETYNKRTISGLGRNGITLVWDGKDLLLIKEKRDYLSLSKLKTWFDSLPKIIPIGDYTISLFDKDARVFLVGCTGEQNYVSYNEIKKVIDFCK